MRSQLLTSLAERMELTKYYELFKSDRKLLYLFLVMLGIRLAVAPFTMHSYDFAIFYCAAHQTVVNHLNVYTYEADKIIHGTLPFPPTWLYVCCILYFLFLQTPLAHQGEIVTHVTPCPFLMNYWLILTLKLPIVFADAAIALFIYLVILEVTNNRRIALMAFCFWAFNTYVILASMRGAFDFIPALLTLLACRYFYKKDYTLSAVSEGLAIAFKTYPVLMLPAFVLPLWLRNRRLSLKYIAISLAIPFVVSLPYLILNAEEFLRIVLRLSSWQGVKVCSIWSLFIWLYEDYGILNLPYTGISSYLMLFIYGVSCWVVGRSVSEESMYSYRACALLLLPYFLTSTLVCDHFFVWLLPLLVIPSFAGDFKARVLVWESVMASCLMACAIPNTLLYEFLVPIFYKNQDYWWWLFWSIYYTLFPKNYIGMLRIYAFTLAFWIPLVYVYIKVGESAAKTPLI